MDSKISSRKGCLWKTSPTEIVPGRLLEGLVRKISVNQNFKMYLRKPSNVWNFRIFCAKRNVYVTHRINLLRPKFLRHSLCTNCTSVNLTNRKIESNHSEKGNKGAELICISIRNIRFSSIKLTQSQKSLKAEKVEIIGETQNWQAW